jgi:hypothetical protein
MLKKYTRASRKLFGLRFHEPLFGGRPAGRLDPGNRPDLADLENPKAPALCCGIAKVRATNEICGEQARSDDPGSGYRLRRRRRETH